jgi:hypothetical protein
VALSADVNGRSVDPVHVRIIGLTSDIHLAIRLLQFPLACRGGHTLLRSAKIRPVLQSLHLKVLEIGVQGLVIERTGHIVIRRHGLISEHVSQVIKSLVPGKYRLLVVALVLQQLNLYHQEIAFAHAAGLVLVLTDIHGFPKTLHSFRGELEG